MVHRHDLAGESGMRVLITIQTPDGTLSMPLEEARAVARLLRDLLANVDAGRA